MVPDEGIQWSNFQHLHFGAFIVMKTAEVLNDPTRTVKVDFKDYYTVTKKPIL